MKLSNLVIDSFIQKFSESDNFCGFTLPFIFANGSPAVVHAQYDTKGKILLSDYGSNIDNFANSIASIDFNAEEKVKELVKPYRQLFVKDGALQAETYKEELDFVLIDYAEVIKCMIDYKYKEKSHHLDSILATIKAKLEQKYPDLMVNPEMCGRSGSKYKFNFGTDHLMIDFAEANKDKTNRLLRKYVDTQNFNHDLKFSVILDDLDNDRYKTEQSILSDYARIEKLSSFLPS